MRSRTAIAITAGALLALAVWPFAMAHRSAAPAAIFTPASVNPDYAQRSMLVAFYERQMREHPDDQISARMLANQYLMRFREQGDLGDVARAERMAQRSLRLQPQGNVQADAALASALLTYHEFRQALRYDREAMVAEPFDDDARAQTASLLMELGEYQAARAVLAHPSSMNPSPTWLSIQARLDEVTGDLAGARALLARAERLVDANLTISAFTRSWYHTRGGQLAFEAGDDETAEREFTVALSIFPNNSTALLSAARYFRARKMWRRALDAARRSAELYPLPQALGYEADAQRALGDGAGAALTDSLIRAEEHLFNAQGVNDRLLANYYAERGQRLAYALHAARSDLARRSNEIYADDTMAWVLAALGRWREARAYALLATREGTQDPELQYHAAIIALHTGHRVEATLRLQRALALNPHFHPVYADDARRELSSIH